jgi:hypothetical protein
MKKIIFLFAAIAALSSCTITKRHYAPGYHVDWKSRNAVKLNQDLVEQPSHQETAELAVQSPTEQVVSEWSSSSIAISEIEEVNSDVADVKGSQLEESNQLPSFSQPLHEEAISTTINESKDEAVGHFSSKPAPEEDINKLALIGFICSVSSLLLVFPALPGLIMSIIGYKQIMQGKGTGKGFAIAGIVIGALYTLVLLFYVAYLALLIIYGGI